MGFVKGNIVPLLKEAKQKPVYGSLLCLGYPDVYFKADQFRDICAYYKIALDPSVELHTSKRTWFRDNRFLSGESLFKSIGFQEVVTMDYSEFEGASVLFDLNATDLPAELNNRFDFIADHGTLEHVFHIPNALNNIFKMLRENGRVLISSPTSNFVDHGFYMFSPTLFFDYFTANQFDIHSIQVTQSSPQQQTDPCFYADYEPGSFNSVSYGGLNNSIYGVICIARKTTQSTGHVIPQQGLYNKIWGQSDGGSGRRGIRRVLGVARRWILRAL
jgi:SAM-dependent methyltransferase